MVVHVLSVAFVAIMVYVSSPGSDTFSWHPACMSLATAMLALQAVLVFSNESSLFPSSPRSEKITLHWILHVFGLVSAAFGFASIYIHKEMSGKKHFTTWHGLLGLITVCGLALAAVGGLLAKNAGFLRSWMRPTNTRALHATAGMLVFMCAMATLCLGCSTNWFKNRVSPWVMRFAFWVPIVMGVCVARQVTQAYMPKVLTQRESELDAKARQIQEKIEAKLQKQKEKKLQKSSTDASYSEETDGDHDADAGQQQASVRSKAE